MPALQNFFTFGSLISTAIIQWIPIWLGTKTADSKGKNPWIMLLGILPFVGWIVFLILCFWPKSKKKKCPVCGKSNDDFAEYCEKCNESFEEPEEEEEEKFAIKPSNKKWIVAAVVISISAILFNILFGWRFTVTF